MVWTARRRKVVYVAFYEFFAILLSAILLRWMTENEEASSLGVASIVSAMAVCWNYIFNTGFEWIENRFRLERTFWVRLVHATGFEGSLILVCIPLYMYWYSISFMQALEMEAGLMAFFFAYTYVFTWIFDQFVPRVTQEDATRAVFAKA